MPSLHPHYLCPFPTSQLIPSPSALLLLLLPKLAPPPNHHYPAGCAAGFGSYVQPPTAGYPYYPPVSCPIWSSKTGSLKTASVRTVLPNGRPGSPVSLNTWYSTKPDFCSRTYYPIKACQGSIPVKTIGFCQCFACPAGEWSYCVGVWCVSE
jgi:hypothetical protein